ncbi:NnrS family protein [Idiomarina loihiensis]|uniref:NnrS family protein n=1 Tax=Idiomarina loihiensis TaxID=135577 RepID=UPI0038507E59
MQITDRQKEEQLTPILRQAFRPLFLLGAGFSAIAMLLWGLALGGKLSLPVYGNIMFWRSHEMIFGFVIAIVLGFLLTAVQNWTGLRAPHGKTLLILTVLWAAARLMLLLGGELPWWLVAAMDVSLLPVAALLFGRMVLKVNQTRNLFFVPILLLLTVCNLLMHYGLHFGHYHIQVLGAYNAVFLVTLLMAIIGGRVLPMFTANGTQTPKVTPIVWLDRIALGSLWLIFAVHFLNLHTLLPNQIIVVLFGVSAVATGVRVARWKIWITWRVPLLWSLHLAYWFIPVGLALFALRYAGFDLTQSVALHALTAGAMGNMILSMIARVSLGHSGRPLQPKLIMNGAFLLVLIAALTRVFLIWLAPDLASQWLMFSAIAWTMAYGIYVVVYFKVLTTPRADGNPG